MHYPTHRVTSTLLLLLLILYSVTGWARAERIAIVIGNSDYQQIKRLKNPAKDARSVAARLAELGFTLIGRDGKKSGKAVLNLDENSFHLTLRHFAVRAEGAEIALIYYAGHGMQDARQSYLLPVDVPGGDVELVIRNSIGLDSLLKRLDGKAELTVAVFDACREIPDLDDAIGELTRDSGIKPSELRGLARVKSKGKSRIVAYSGAAGQLVKDGQGSHSPYTDILLQELQNPGGEVDDVFQKVAWNFGQRYGGQNPEVLIQGVQPGRFYLSPGRGGITPPPAPPSPVNFSGHLQVNVNVSNAEVRVKGKRMGYASPGQPLNLTNLPLGDKMVEVRAAGYTTKIQRLTVARNQWNQAVFTLVSVARQPAPAIFSPAVPEKRSHRESMRKLNIVRERELEEL